MFFESLRRLCAWQQHNHDLTPSQIQDFESYQWWVIKQSAWLSLISEYILTSLYLLKRSRMTLQRLKWRHTCINTHLPFLWQCMRAGIRASAVTWCACRVHSLRLISTHQQVRAQAVLCVGVISRGAESGWLYQIKISLMTKEFYCELRLPAGFY